MRGIVLTEALKDRPRYPKWKVARSIWVYPTEWIASLSSGGVKRRVYWTDAGDLVVFGDEGPVYLEEPDLSEARERGRRKFLEIQDDWAERYPRKRDGRRRY